MLGNFSEDAQLVLFKARDEMCDLNHPYIGTEHLVLSILKNNDGLSNKLYSYGLTYDNFKNKIIDTIGVGSKKSKFFLHTPLLKKVVENAMLDARDEHNGEVSVLGLFSSLLEEGEGIAIRIFISMGINLDDMYEEFSTKMIKKSKKKKKRLYIEEVGIDLVDQAKKGYLDPVIGRDLELERLIEILCRRVKNNPILVGEAGVGKTAIVEALSMLIAQGDVPDSLIDKRIISVDMATLVSGTKYRGEFEERMQKLIKEVSDDGNIILFIDEVHTLVGAGGAEGAIDASNILKPALARGSIRCIGATTILEYKKYIESDKALSRRFQKIMIEETNVEATLDILYKLKPIYERYHHVVIHDDVLKNIVELSNQYIFNRYNPDKALDILDEVASMVSIRKSDEEIRVKSLKSEIANIQKKKNDLILDNDVESAYDYLKKESLLTSKLNQKLVKIQKNYKLVSLDDVALVIQKRTGVPIYEILKDKDECFKEIRKELSNCICGQEEAINSLMESVKKIRFGYDNGRVKSYFFVGPTGVGKTKLAKSFASLLVGSDNFIRLDMSEYADAMSIHKIIGADPGYVGYQDHNTVVEKIKDKPNAVILFDEIDKAHPVVINLLYQLLDEGEIRDNQNQVVHLNHNIVIMTSNMGFESNKLGFCSDKVSDIRNALKEKLSDSLINRIDYIITFNYLENKDMIKIVNHKLKMLREKYDNFSYSSSLVNEIVKMSDYKIYGARRVDRIIDSKLENLIIDRLIEDKDLNIKHLYESMGTV